MEPLVPPRPYQPCLPCANMAVLMLSGCTGYSLYQYFANRPYVIWYRHLGAVALPVCFAGLTVRQWGLRRKLIEADKETKSPT